MRMTGSTALPDVPGHAAEAAERKQVFDSQLQTIEDRAVLVASEPVAISGDFKCRPQACAGRSPSDRAEIVTA